MRYEWFFGDGPAPVYFPDVNHVFGFPGTYPSSYGARMTMGCRAWGLHFPTLSRGAALAQRVPGPRGPGTISF